MSENQENNSVQNVLASKPASWTGIGQRDVLAASFNGTGPSDFSKLQASPVIFTYNFPGVLGTADFQSDALPGSPVGFNSQRWDYSLKWPWVIEQRVLEVDPVVKTKAIVF